jgi:hypothetical protein
VLPTTDSVNILDRIDRLIRKHKIKLLSNGKLKIRNVNSMAEREKVRKNKKKIIERIKEKK